MGKLAACIWEALSSETSQASERQGDEGENGKKAESINEIVNSHFVKNSRGSNRKMIKKRRRGEERLGQRREIMGNY